MTGVRFKKIEVQSTLIGRVVTVITWLYSFNLTVIFKN